MKHLLILGKADRQKFGTLHKFACHPCAGARRMFSVEWTNRIHRIFQSRPMVFIGFPLMGQSYSWDFTTVVAFDNGGKSPINSLIVDRESWFFEPLIVGKSFIIYLTAYRCLFFQIGISVIWKFILLWPESEVVAVLRRITKYLSFLDYCVVCLLFLFLFYILQRCHECPSLDATERDF